VARAFHSFYTECRVLSDDPHLTKARLLLIRAARIVLHNTLALMGVSAPERMEPRETG
jgi:arginyl-tRNA synthetase